ncbi:MAG: hypothetical protein A2068_03725 [Ignavibacteria bacterium GWB2_35_6b]|nr:MAG: hypothetical protein A2068_03725 [Ignavibacteria bacterium GWB2_35_6b]OGU66305.1 MAG: hypothetical protein A2X62_12300 [Stygiobacter sp. GWC2_38_9]
MVNTNNITDDQIIERVRANETEMFSFIIKKYNQRLYRVAVSYGVYDDDCDEVIQRTYIAAFEKLNTFKGNSKFSTWLIKILINECLMLKRKYKKNHAVKEDELMNLQSDDTISPEKAVMNKETKIFVESAINDLPEKYKQVFILKEVEGMSIEETSEVLLISKTNVKVRLHRAKSMLRDFLTSRIGYEGLFIFGNERCDNITSKVMLYMGNYKTAKN